MLAPPSRFSRLTLSTAALLFLLTGTSGCGSDRYSRRARASLIGAVVTLLVRVVQASSNSSRASSEESPRRLSPRPPTPPRIPRILPPAPEPPPAPVLSWKDPPPPPVASPENPTGFSVRAARRSLEEVDLGVCYAQGVPRGYVRATGTFESNGGLSSVELEDPRDLVTAARDCLRSRIQTARMPAFTGKPVSVAATWFVHCDACDNAGSHP
jgi:hypothetical protein